MQINSISIAQVLDWFKMGWIIFINNPLQWFFILIVLFIISVVSNLIPLLGGLIFIVISPALFAGIFLATQKSANGEEINVMDLFSIIGDSSRRKAFFSLGMLSLLVNVMVLLIMFLPMMGAAGLGSMSSNQSEMMPVITAGVGFGSLLLIVPLLIMYIMAMVYALPLMLFSNQGIKQSLLLSLKASVSNIFPMMVASVIFLVLFLLALIPVGLGLLVLIPVSFGVIYSSYKDIFR
jgi:uncharacterized membrane protein